MSLTSVTIVGGGLSGFTVAQELRARGFEGSVSIVDTDGLPYDRPPLSKRYLLGEASAEDLRFAAPAWFAEHQVDVVTASAARIQPDAGTVVLSDGRHLSADAVVLATGGAARRLPIPGGDLESVWQLRTRQDADRLRAALHQREGARLAIIGAGLIGAEVASSALALGAQVSLIDPIETPLAPAVGPDLARRLHAMHAERGVTTLTGVPTAITAHAAGHRIDLGEAGSLDADVVLVGIGIVPRTELAEAAGLDVDDGVLVNAAQRTSHPRVYAVGDVARTRTADGRLLRRAEHWEHAMHAGTTAAAALLGQEPPRHGASWFWSDRYGVHLEAVGDLSGPGSTVLRRDADGAVAAAFRLAPDGGMAGAAAIDGGLTIRAARRIIDRGIPVDPDLLADPEVPVKRLAR
ncbi:NAD(P)/FAD-dependent oxidoreductase [Zhihengliuella flava]|uniref:NADPH-dependent 2,4-dienoyl-CoA reductase/sulfur reductase-like enzyme n=1 Tax=Zhihengliuella flava TaxID=1285193 RepID=A0A931D6A4_9MICC|nr:FAD-dependent oxidoreductase [Zhihengliuella flava]MBG6084490.1 NADPH-dependent 2,4-dienoyl-CoA reductase/sulfur reductase-like enzyme [Zhihengliuella flava]